MKQIYLFLPYVVACVTLFTGILCLIIAAKGKRPTELGYALLALTLILFFLIPPHGYLPFGGSAHGEIIVIKLIVISISFVASAWMAIISKSINKIVIGSWLLAISGCTTFMYFTDQGDTQVLWWLNGAVATGGIFILALRAVWWQYQQIRDNTRIKQMIGIFGLYQLLFLAVTLGYVTKLFPAGTVSVNTSTIYIFSLIFVLTFVAMFAVYLSEQSKLEKVLQINEKRLKSVMEKAPVIVVELDHDGRISYINDYGMKLLGYREPNEVISLDWFSTFLLPSDSGLLKKLYCEIFKGNLVTPTFKNTIRSKDGTEVIVSWVNFLEYETDGTVEKVISIGRDISGEESANRLVAQMQKELQKEEIPIHRSFLFEVEENVVGKSKAFTYAIQRAMQVANTHAPVLLEGETGVGKEVFANIIHKNSSRSKMPFIKINCGALPKELIEDELFGHEKGAFTSAIQARKGRFELADGGTIFLDEIGELPLEMQPKLLRVLQNGEFERIGGQKTMKVDVRILAATNRTLSDEISNGNFREDLYYRLNVFPITIPPLRNRKEDLPDLIQFFIASKCEEYGKVLESISSADLQRLIEHPWPGNIRELKNVIERAVIVSEGKLLKLKWWHENERNIEIPTSQTLEKIERDHIISVMEKCHWKINGDHGAAEVLNLHPNTLRSKMKRLGISRPQPKITPEFTPDQFFYPRESMG